MKRNFYNWLQYLRPQYFYFINHIKYIFKKLNIFLLNIIPLFSVIVLGIFFVALSFYSPWFKEILAGIGIAFFCLLINPVIKIFYNYVNQKLHPEIFEFVNLKISKIIIRLLYRFCRFVTPDLLKDITLDDIKRLGKLNRIDLENTLKSKNFLGFHIFIKWDKYIEKIDELLSEDIISKNLNHEQCNNVLTIVKAIKTWQNILNDNFDKLFIPLKMNVTNLSIYVDNQELYTLIFDNEQIDWAFCNSAKNKELKHLYRLNPEFIEPITSNIMTIISYFDDLVSSFDNRIILEQNEIRKSNHKRMYKEIFSKPKDK